MKLLSLALMLAVCTASMCAARSFVGSFDLREVTQPLKHAEDGFVIKTEQFVYDFNTLLSDSALSWHGNSSANKHTAMTAFLGRYKAALRAVDKAVSNVSMLYKERPESSKQFAVSELSRNVDQCRHYHQKMINRLQSTLKSFEKQGTMEAEKVATADKVLLKATQKIWSYRVQFISRFIATLEKIFEIEQVRLNGLIKGLM